MWGIFKKLRIPDKIEFIKKEETGTNGVSTYYYTKKNGSHVSNSLSYNKSTALATFNKIKNGISLESEEVLETEFI